MTESMSTSRIYLEWYGLYDERPIGGVTILCSDHSDRIATLQVYYRPIEQVGLFSTEVKASLNAT